MVEQLEAQPGTERELALETPLLSVIIPVYNEEHHVAEVIRRVRDVPIPKEIIVVDDGSTDRTVDELEQERKQGGDLVRVHQAMINMGKGTAVRIGLKYARGDIILIQDSDLEYDPADYPALLEPIRSGEADVVYGNRFPTGAFPAWVSSTASRTRSWPRLRPRCTRQRIRDEATAYKVFRRDVILDLDLHASRFELCPEVTAKVRKRGYRIHHVPISYTPRTVEQGKKVRLRDAFHAMWVLFLVPLRRLGGFGEIWTVPPERATFRQTLLAARDGPDGKPEPRRPPCRGDGAPEGTCRRA